MIQGFVLRQRSGGKGVKSCCPDARPWETPQTRQILYGSMGCHGVLGVMVMRDLPGAILRSSILSVFISTSATKQAYRVYKLYAAEDRFGDGLI